MKNKLFTLFTIIMFVFNASAQECNCSESFDWMVNTFEKNDAGFQYVIDKKGEDEYKKHTALYKEKAKGITNLNDCQAIMYGWLRYFRPGHIFVNIKESGKNGKEPSDEEIRLQYKNAKTIDLTEKQLINSLEKKHNKNPIEGVWSNGDYSIGIISEEKSSKNFTAFIIKADSVYWLPKQIKAEFTLNDDAKIFSVDYYMRNHSKEVTQAKFIDASCTLLSLYGNYWTRIYPKSALTKKEDLLISFSKSNLPFVEKLSDKTIYLRIPSFASEQKKNIDSVLAKYDKQISSTQNLIIDIRNGTGGSDDSYSNLVPYLYTNPIRGMGVQLLATELNAKGYERYAKQYSDTENINYCNGVAAKMRANLGKFIALSDKTYGIDSLAKVLPYPQKVAVICNQNNGSTDEQFLLEAKQSRKVKVFGRPTGGMLDISNMNVIDFPNGKFVLGYCMSKSYRIPNYCIDGVGIQPDYFIDDAISDEDWIEYTKSVLEQ
ncbi:MAG: S41 family peptidase [Bacteroidota bacterium]|nr:S41 family peptidase [Bacteroidota bacterium]